MLSFIFSLILIYALIIMLGATDSGTEDADYLIVLGSGLEDNKISPCLASRCDKAVNYLYKNLHSKVVLSGGFTNFSKISEASAMKEFLIERGIREERIILEEESTDTIENIANSFKLIDKSKKIVILSNNYHLFRAKMIAYLNGVKCKGIGVKTETLDLIKHLAIEEVYIIKNIYRIKKGNDTTI